MLKRKTTFEDRTTLGKLILWFIGTKKEVKMPEKGTGEVITVMKENDGEASVDKILEFGRKVLISKFHLSRATVYRYLKEFHEKRLIDYIGSKRVRITEDGKQMVLFMDDVNLALRNFDLYPNLPATIIFRGTPEKPAVSCHLKIEEPNDAKIVLRAYEKFGKSDRLEFLRGVAGAQRMGLLLYCRRLIDPQVQELYKELEGKEFVTKILQLFDFDSFE